MKKTNQRRETDSTMRWKVYLLIFTCGLLFVAGFFFAGRQHFSSMDYGMKNSRLRKQIEDLENEKRRLILAREVSLTPTEIRKAAKKLGLDAPAAEPAAPVPTTAALSKPAPSANIQTASLVIKTSSVTKAVPAPSTVSAKTDKGGKNSAQIEKPAKRTPAAE